MRIFPSNSKITMVDEINQDIDVPIAYVDADSSRYTSSLTVEPEFTNKKKEEIFPYYRFKTSNTVIFDKNENPVDREQILKDLVRDKEEYIYIPSKSRSFKARDFYYQVIGKRDSLYQMGMAYNIDMLCYACKSYANNLISIFGDSYKKGQAPSNITVNNGDLSIQSFLDRPIVNTDIILIRLKNDTTIIEDDMKTGGVKETKFDKKAFLTNFKKNMIGVYDCSLSIDSSPGINNDKVSLYHEEKESEYKTVNGIINNDLAIKSKKFFNIPNKGIEGIKYHSLFTNNNKTPILIEEHIDKGFFIYITDEIIVSCREHKKLIYEALMNIFLKSYMFSDPFYGWVADVMPDYIVKDMALTKEIDFTSTYDLSRIFNLKNDEITAKDVIINKDAYPFVEFVGVKNSFLTFKKNDDTKYKDPFKKNDDEISVYSNGKIFLYTDRVYLINDKLDEHIYINMVNNSVHLYHSVIRHTGASIYSDKITEPIVIDFLSTSKRTSDVIEHTVFALYFKQNENAGFIEYKPYFNYSKSDGVLIGAITIKRTDQNIAFTDMRIRGGGLPKTEEDNLNCLDIGHVLGRPYRKGATTIITLPKSLKEYENIIKETLHEYSAAGEYHVICYEGEK